MARRQRLIERRGQLRLSQATVAKRVGCDPGTVRRWELGATTPRPSEWRPLAEALEWNATQVAVALSDEDQSPVKGHAVPGWLGHLASLEQAAGELCAFEATTVHGLLQTADYATAVETFGPVRHSAAEIASRVASRLARQAVLSRDPDPLQLSVILDESVLRRIAGDPATMAVQLDHLLAIADEPNVELRVLSLGAGVFVFGSFTLFALPGAHEPYMACVEDRAGAHYLDREQDRQIHTDLFAYLMEVALDPDGTADVITSTAKEYRQ
jgi:transcriptional regulator with XRE-family HTH domain